MIEYLDESTNTVKSNDLKNKTVIISAYIAIWAFAILFFWLFTDGSEAMGYSVVFLLFLMPIVTFVFSLLIGKNDHFGKWKWFAVPIFGAMYMLAEYLTFSLANMLAFDKLNMPDPINVFIGAAISAAGLGIGVWIKRLLKSKPRREKDN